MGKLPLDVRALEESDIKLIRECIPIPPSVRINEKEDASVFQVARRRGVDPSQLKQFVKGKLDRIVLKCLQKEPRRRYAAVSELTNAACSYLKWQPRVWLFRRIMVAAAVIFVAILSVSGWIHHANGVQAKAILDAHKAQTKANLAAFKQAGNIQLWVEPQIETRTPGSEAECVQARDTVNNAFADLKRYNISSCSPDFAKNWANYLKDYSKYSLFSQTSG